MHDLFSSSTVSGGVWIAAAAGVALLALAGFVLAVLRSERTRDGTAAQIGRLAEIAESLSRGQAELAGRLQQSQAGLDHRLDSLSHRLGEGLIEHGERTSETLRALHERLALIDAAQKSITALSSEVAGLQDILANKQARGAFGEVQLEALVASMLPADAFRLQATLTNRCRADCLLTLPDPPGPIVIDSKFPLESYRLLCAARDEVERSRAARAFAQDVLRHVRDIEAKYIVPGETADSAMMFLPSEAVYAELHAHFRNVVEDSFRRKVWIVSPSTLWATLNTVRAVLRDVRLKRQATVIQAELRAIVEDVARIDQRAANLQRHFDQATDDLRQIRVSTDKLAMRASRLDLVAIGDGDEDGNSERNSAALTSGPETSTASG
ncbi:MAG: DNA recombination protein RmuC [Rhodospirillales bacterium]|nr:DNA recombination protein RmuC [Rhodospirillales bacterium]